MKNSASFPSIMTLWEIIKEHLREELALLKDIERYRSITTVRLIAICVLAVVGVAIQQVLAEKIAFDIGFVLAIFSIFISWLFFWAADRSSKQQMDHLTQFLRDFKSGSEKQIESLRSELSGAFKTGSALPPKLPEPDLVRHLRHVFVAAAGEVHDDGFVLHGSAIPKSRQIFRARNLLISVCLGTAERRFLAGFPHHE